MRIRFFIMLILVIGLITADVLMSGGTLGAFIKAPSIAVVIGGAFFLSSISHSPGEVAKQFGIAFGTGNNRRALQGAGAFFDSLRGFLYLMGVIGSAVGFVSMLFNFTDPTELGIGIAKSFLSIFTAILFDAFVVSPCKSSIAKQTAALE